MANNIDAIAKQLGAKRICSVPDTGSGALGASRLAIIIAQLRDRRDKARESLWTHHVNVGMNEETHRKLEALADSMSESDHTMSPGHLASQLLEFAVTQVTNHEIEPAQKE